MQKIDLFFVKQSLPRYSRIPFIVILSEMPDDLLRFQNMSRSEFMQVRTFRWSDMPLIVEVMNRYAWALGSDSQYTQAEVEENWRAPYNHPEENCFVAVLPDEGLIGFAIADLLDDP